MMSAARVESDGRAAPYRVVVVEDEAILALSLERTLREFGLDVRGVAANAEEAIALADAERPDLLVMDIRIQGPRDGVETADVIRRAHDAAIVYLTAHSDPNTIARARETRPAGYLLKPFKKVDLQNLVSIALARRDAELELRGREEVLRITLSALDEAVLTTDLAGSVVSVNEAATALVGRADDEVLRQPLAQVLPLRKSDGQPLPADVFLAARHEARLPIDGVLETRDGPRTVVGTAVSVRQQGAPIGVVVALRDLTELLSTRRQLEFAERLSSLGSMAAGVAHELNNPLSVVLSNLGFALEESVTGELRQVILEAKDAAGRASRIVADLRSLSRPQPEKLQPTDLCDVLRHALNFTRSTWRAVASVELHLGPSPAVLVSPTRITQVLVNLITNAAHAMQGLPGRAHVLTLKVGTDDGDRAVLEVHDTGPGIDDALRERIFEPFFTTKPPGQGTGLGLAVSRSIVEQHGATLSLDSSSAGSRFTLSFASVGDKKAAPPPVVWLGAQTEESARLGCIAAAPTEDDVRRALRDAENAVIVTTLTRAALHPLLIAVPELDGRVVWAGDEPPVRGEVRVRRPFDVASLACFARQEH